MRFQAIHIGRPSPSRYRHLRKGWSPSYSACASVFRSKQLRLCFRPRSSGIASGGLIGHVTCPPLHFCHRLFLEMIKSGEFLQVIGRGLITHVWNFTCQFAKYGEWSRRTCCFSLDIQKLKGVCFKEDSPPDQKLCSWTPLSPLRVLPQTPVTDSCIRPTFFDLATPLPIVSFGLNASFVFKLTIN